MDKSSQKLVKNEGSGSKTDAGTQECIQRPRSNWKWVILYIQTWQELKAHKKGQQNTFLTIFMCFDFFLVCLHVLSPTFNHLWAPCTHSWVPRRVFEPDCLFSICFQLLSTIFSCFFSYIIRFNLFFIDFIYFWLSLFVFNYFYQNLSVTACFHLFF